MEKKRIIWADSLKGWLMILVIFGHSIQIVLDENCFNNRMFNIIYSFHMPAFMVVSGWFAYKCNRRKVVYLDACARRANQVLVPYFVWSLLFWILSGCHIERLSMLITTPDSYLWFLWIIFWISLIFIGCQWSADKMKIDELIPVSLISIILIGVMLGLEFRMFGFQFLAYYFLFYLLGYCIHRFNFLQLKNNYVMGGLAVFWAFFAWFWNMHELPFWMPTISNLPVSLLQYTYRGVTALIAVIVLIGVAPKILDVDTKINVFIKNLGVVSLGLYAVHLTMMRYIKELLFMLVPQCPIWCAIMIIFIITFILSVAAVELLNKNKWIARICLGKL